MIQIPVTTNGNSKIKVSIDGKVYLFSYKYNTRNRRLFLTISLDDEVLISGLRLVEEGVPIKNYSITELAGYQLYIFKNTEGTDFVTLGNLGLDLEYMLLLFTPEEIEEITNG